MQLPSSLKAELYGHHSLTAYCTSVLQTVALQVEKCRCMLWFTITLCKRRFCRTFAFANNAFAGRVVIKRRLKYFAMTPWNSLRQFFLASYPCMRPPPPWTWLKAEISAKVMGEGGGGIHRGTTALILVSKLNGLMLLSTARNLRRQHFVHKTVGG